MISYAEQFGFEVAYAMSVGATIALITTYAAFGMKMKRKTTAIALMLILLYGVLYLILKVDEYALLAGSTLAFLALAATMYVTGNEKWHDPEDPASNGFLPFGAA